MADFRKLVVWQKAHEVALNSHRVAKSIRGSMYGPLRQQIVRSAMSIPANIVEGRAQKSEKDFSRFLGYAAASAAELEYHLLVATDVGAINKSASVQLIAAVSEVGRMLTGLTKRLRSDQEFDGESTSG
jgi:four helix bundle protein